MFSNPLFESYVSSSIMQSFEDASVLVSDIDLLISEDSIESINVELSLGRDLNAEALTSSASFVQVHNQIEVVGIAWASKIVPVPPLDFLSKILRLRGYVSLAPISYGSLRKEPTPKQMADYTSELILAVRTSDLGLLMRLHEQGACMNACNKYGESVVHLACRRASFEVVDYILKNGGDPCLVDDFGRTPFHDACWRFDTRFDVAALLLHLQPDLIRVQDVRGALPLAYVVEENWLKWCAFLFNQRGRYWPLLSPEAVPPSSSGSR